MDPTTIIAIIIAVIITIALYWASSTANRLHRLHVRTDAARQSLQASLDRRAAVLAACEPQFTALAHSTESIPLQYETFAQRFPWPLPVSRIPPREALWMRKPGYSSHTGSIMMRCLTRGRYGCNHLFEFFGWVGPPGCRNISNSPPRRWLGHWLPAGG